MPPAAVVGLAVLAAAALGSGPETHRLIYAARPIHVPAFFPTSTGTELFFGDAALRARLLFFRGRITYPTGPLFFFFPVSPLRSFLLLVSTSGPFPRRVAAAGELTFIAMQEIIDELGATAPRGKSARSGFFGRDAPTSTSVTLFFRFFIFFFRRWWLLEEES